MNLPDTMIAIDPAKPGGPEVLATAERPVPRAGPGEVLVKVAAAGVNRPDLMQRQGNYPPPPGAPSIPGLELAGTVVAGEEDWIGREVCALVAGGGYAQFAVVPVGQLLPRPDALSPVEAAGLPETLFTVWHNLFQRGGAARGDTVLVHGGTSGIGTTAILLGQLLDIDVIVTAGSEAKCARALDIGAAHAINYRRQDFVDEVKRLTAGRGVQVVLDMVGGDYVARNLECLAEEGRHVSIATQRGGEAAVPIWTVMRKRLTLTGSTLRARDLAFKSGLRAEIEAKVWPFAAEGRLRPAIERTFPLAKAADAHRWLEGGEHVGKVVLTVG